MASFEHVILEADPHGDHWLNTDPQRFAVSPDVPDSERHGIAQIVNTAVEEYVGSTSGDEKDEILRELIDLSKQGFVLWPMGTLFGHSVLGKVDIRRFEVNLRVEGSEFLTLLDALENDAESPFSHYQARQKRNFALSTWKSLTSLRLATTKPLTTLFTFDHDDFETFATIVRPAGEWVDWYTRTNRQGMQYTVAFMTVKLSDRHFGASLVRVNNSTLPGPRLRDPFAVAPELKWLDTLYEQFLDETKVLLKKIPRLGKRLIAEFFISRPEGVPSRVDSAFSGDNMRAMLKFAATWSTPSQRVLALGKINDFIDFLERQHSSGALKTENHILLGLQRHEVEHFVKGIHVPMRSSSSGDVQARPMPTRYHIMLKEMITEDDFAWPRSLRNEVNGRLLHWVPYRDPTTGKWSEVFCPVLARLLLLQLDLPLRNIQARRLDSGEGDTERWNSMTGEWERNTGPHGGRWERMGAVNPRRGVVRRIANGEGRSITGLWINSNKTQDRDNLFDDTAGYQIPWQHVEVLENLSAMREWQERYNPVEGPLPHAALPPNIFDDEPSEEVRAVIPDRFYLFRYPSNHGPRGTEAPPSYPIFLQFFYDALEELERRLNRENPERPVTLITLRDKSGAPKRAIYTMHGMRSSTLTGLHLAGVPIEILSKVVAGHASILMTLRYVKLDPLHVSQVLSDARLKAANEAKAQFPNILGSASFENALRMTARLSDDGMHQIKGAYSEPSVWLRLDIGLCPNGGTQCRIGGEVIQHRNDKGADKSVYGPVPGGARNCVRCRFFVTGLPFLIPLWSHGCSIMVRADGLAREAAERDTEIRELKRQRKALRDRNHPIPVEMAERIAIVEELHIGACEHRDQAFADFHATLAIVEKVRAISEEMGADGEDRTVPMLVPDNEAPEMIGRESTRFEIVDAVVQQSRCFPSLASADIERERDEFLNQILYRNGYVPITMSPLSLPERRHAADAMAAFLLMVAGAADAEQLAAGRKTLSDLGLQEKLEVACRKAIGKPLDRIATLPPVNALPSYVDIQAAE